MVNHWLNLNNCKSGEILASTKVSGDKKYVDMMKSKQTIEKAGSKQSEQLLNEAAPELNREQSIVVETRKAVKKHPTISYKFDEEITRKNSWHWWSKETTNGYKISEDVQEEYLET